MGPRYDVIESLAGVAPAAIWVRGALEAAGAPEPVRQDVDVCLEEALANLILHAVARGASKGVALELDLAPGRAAVRVIDACAPFDPVKAPPLDPGAMAIGGRGIRLMRALAHDLAYTVEPHRNVLAIGFSWPTADAIARALGHISVLARLTPEDRAALAAAGTLAFHQPGAILLREGANSDLALAILEGEAEVLAGGSGADAAPLAHLSAPALVGEIGALAGLTRTATVRARTRVVVLRLPPAALLSAGRGAPDFLVDVVGRLGGQIRSVNHALAVYAAAFQALERGDLDDALLARLRNPSADLAAFGAAFERLASRVAQERRMRADMASAAMIQRALLPAGGAMVALADHIDAFADIRPARDVGGDLFDLFPLADGRVVAAIGDVCGKGVPASLFMASTLMALRMAAQAHDDAAAIVAAANDVLCARNDMSMFTTAIVALIDPRARRVRYVSCGHNPPVHLRADGGFEWAPAKGAPMGLFPGRTWVVREVELAPGDSFVLYTDGVTEAFDPQDNEYGEDRLTQVLASASSLDAAGIVRAVMDDVARFADGADPSDDITCLCVKLA
ncbi:MAG: SpoIIE family protein phosphatase [Caulobacterales bacterium]